MIANYLPSFLANLASQLPTLLAFLVGLIIAIVTRKRHPKASLFALIAFIVLILTIILETLTNTLLPMMHESYGMFDFKVYHAAFTVLNVLWALLRTGAYGLIIAAIFGSRTKKEVEEPKA